MVLEISLALAGVIPHWIMSTTQEFALRLLITEAGVFVLWFLGQISALRTAVLIFWPGYWITSWFNRNGTAAICVLGIEFLGMGYAIMGSTQLFGWMLVLIGSAYLVRFSSLERRTKPDDLLAYRWWRLNWIFMVGACVKVFLSII